MLTFMKKDHNFDGEDSSVKKDPNAPKPEVQFMGWQDGLVLLVIVALVAGGYYYYKTSKEKAAAAFERCSAAYVAEEFLAAEACYDSTWDLGYVTDTMELVRQERLGFIADKRLSQADAFDAVEDLLAKGDSAAGFAELAKVEGPILLLGDRRADWDKWSELAKAFAPKDAVPADSSKESTAPAGDSENAVGK